MGQRNSDVRRRLAWGGVVAFAAVSLAGLAVSLGMMTIDRSESLSAGATNLRSLWPYWVAAGSTWAALTAMWVMLRRETASVGRNRVAIGELRSFIRSALLIALVAIGVRAAVLVTHEPALSDDVYRYIFEGRTFAAGFNPYAVRALDREGMQPENFRGESDLVKIMTYHELATPYLPVSQFVFGALGLIIDDRWTDAVSSAMVFRVGYTLIELVLIVLLFMAVRRVGRSPWWVALYAWHPLPISEIAASGHQDGVGIVLVVAALLCFLRDGTAGRVWRWATLLGLATVVKPVAAIAGVFILAQRLPPRSVWKALAIGATIIVLMTSLFWVIPSSGSLGFRNWLHTVSTLGEKWAHFGGVYEPVLYLVREAMPAEGKPAGYNLVQETLARRVCVVALGLTIVALLAVNRRRASESAVAETSQSRIASSLRVWKGTAAALFAIVLFTTTAHPWYLLWAFALVPLGNNWPLWILSLTISWGHVYWVSGKGHWGGQEWTVQPLVIAAAYVPVFIAAVVEIAIQWRGRAKPQAVEIVHP